MPQKDLKTFQQQRNSLQVVEFVGKKIDNSVNKQRKNIVIEFRSQFQLSMV